MALFIPPCRSKLTYGRRLESAAPTSRLHAVRTQEDVTILLTGIESHAKDRFVPLGLPAMISCPAIVFSRVLFPARLVYTAFMIAPSITTPAVTYFHSATSSLRARATIVTLRRLSILARSRNHLLSSESG